MLALVVTMEPPCLTVVMMFLSWNAVSFPKTVIPNIGGHQDAFLTNARQAFSLLLGSS